MAVRNRGLTWARAALATSDIGSAMIGIVVVALISGAMIPSIALLILGMVGAIALAIVGCWDGEDAAAATARAIREEAERVRSAAEAEMDLARRQSGNARAGDGTVHINVHDTAVILPNPSVVVTDLQIGGSGQTSVATCRGEVIAELAPMEKATFVLPPAPTGPVMPETPSIAVLRAVHEMEVGTALEFYDAIRAALLKEQATVIVERTSATAASDRSPAAG